MLEDAIISGSAAILRLFLQQYKTRDHELIQHAVFYNRIDCLQVLIDAGHDVNPPCKTPIYTAVQQRKIDIVKLLCESGADPCQSNGNNPSLVYAACHDFVDMIPFLLTPRTSKACVQQAMMTAVPSGNGFCHSLLQYLRQRSQRVSPNLAGGRETPKECLLISRLERGEIL